LDEVRDYAVSQADNPCQPARSTSTRAISVSHWSSSASRVGTGVAPLPCVMRWTWDWTRAPCPPGR